MSKLKITPSIIPNLFTALNMFSGFLSIIYSSNSNFVYAGWLIIVAAIFDTLDGLMARLTKSSSELGVELDSLSDVVSFGAAPSFLLYKTYFFNFDTAGIILSSLPLIAGGFRLARFNVQLVGFDKKYFTGLPIPSAAIFFSTFILSFYQNGFNKIFEFTLIPSVIFISYLMVSKVRYETIPKFSYENFKSKPLHFMFIFLSFLAVIIFYVKGLFFSFVAMITIGFIRHYYLKFFHKTTRG
ncbi:MULTISPECIES: CDP-diacylglycerol--serine O-phosphatidyltransferase [Ignavibacterium]|jgi:CDP-diacylglycerol--serine O-phosphatidyltransferase|uniref:CDP-diacylglycerol--serine O-phosphatidyltransferase n=1 Tax=Ignavibacterium TaxID=795750 RepID=UPI0025C2169C|nr:MULTISPECIES: CDP-diacylglycerol--serine O-phosphatidyltransferase [Ignavibacterium]MBI5663250.1 CDP-diacylglycerol--serine O-phosphatidyltransferase [Ignavibacterium album]